ncbi:hypothetical protein [Halorhabdus rudnickae]|nr:hypothetical protein [Halorhabdus rudnickae]
MTETETETRSTSEDDETEENRQNDHLDGVEDGCGCAEVWEHLSEERGDD